jgi:hypothetical protein
MMTNNQKQKYKESKTELLNLNNSFQLHLIPKILKSLQSNTVPEYILGLKKLKDCIIGYFDQIFSNSEMQIIEIDQVKVTLYNSARINSGEIIRATKKFHDKSYFSNITIKMEEDSADYYTDDGVCYGKVGN